MTGIIIDKYYGKTVFIADTKVVGGTHQYTDCKLYKMKIGKYIITIASAGTDGYILPYMSRLQDLLEKEDANYTEVSITIHLLEVDKMLGNSNSYTNVISVYDIQSGYEFVLAVDKDDDEPSKGIMISHVLSYPYFIGCSGILLNLGMLMRKRTKPSLNKYQEIYDNVSQIDAYTNNILNYSFTHKTGISKL